jgi:hypothetical protein
MRYSCYAMKVDSNYERLNSKRIWELQKDKNSIDFKVHRVDSDEPEMCNKDKHERNQTYKNMAKEKFSWINAKLEGYSLIN